jgi:hypothetical protein
LSGSSTGRSFGWCRGRIFFPSGRLRLKYFQFLFAEGTGVLAPAPETAFLLSLLFHHRVLPGN